MKMKIKKFNEFDQTNEGLRSGLSILGLLIGLGLGKPETILANKEKIENSINDKEAHILNVIDSLDKEESDTIFNRDLPIVYLSDAIEKYNYSTPGTNLRLDEVIKKMQQPNFPVKIDLFFTGNLVPITTLEYQLNDKVTFMLTKNDVWDKNLLGFRLNL